MNGCFWHKHNNCKNSVTPKTNTEFWVNKIDRNVARDQENREILERDNWVVITVWECEIESNLTLTGLNIINKIKND